MLMKKIALLQLLLLPLASLADATVFPAQPARSVERCGVESVWNRCEAGLEVFARRLVGVGYAQVDQIALGSVDGRRR
jgi:hypothetical protein